MSSEQSDDSRYIKLKGKQGYEIDRNQTHYRPGYFKVEEETETSFTARRVDREGNHITTEVEEIDPDDQTPHLIEKDDLEYWEEYDPSDPDSDEEYEPDSDNWEKMDE